jgi:hypothetical protein
MSSENPSSADNQQETVSAMLELEPNWVVGFVDGEGCFSVSIHRNPGARSTRGWQLNPVFHVYQHQEYRMVLEALERFFGCGCVRSKGAGSSVMTYAVHGLQRLEEVILPFFECHPLVVKAQDFQNFATIVRLLRSGDHRKPEGFEHAVRLAFAMNANGKQRKRTIEQVLAGSSETARQARPHHATWS